MNLTLTQVVKYLFFLFGGWIGWLVGEFEPVFPLIIVMILFVLYDAYTAYLLDKRVKKKYPDKTKRHEAKFKSFYFGKVVKKTIPERIALIILAFLAEKYVFLHVDWHLEFVATGLCLFEQAWSCLENSSSCRDDNNRLWSMLQKIMVSKVERHFDVNLDEFKNKEEDVC